MKAISIRTFLTFLLMPLFITEFSFANSRMEVFQGSLAYKPIYIIHTVQKNESIWKIAKRFDVDFTKLVKRNVLDNPDLIFPGNKLIVKIQEDGSILVMPNQKPEIGTLPFNYTLNRLSLLLLIQTRKMCSLRKIHPFPMRLRQQY